MNRPVLGARGLALAVVVALAGCQDSPPTKVVTVDVPGAAATPATKVHWEVWAAEAATDNGSLAAQDDVAVTALPTLITVARGSTNGPWYWLSAWVDLDGDGTVDPDDWVLAPAPAVTTFTDLGKAPVWKHPEAPTAAQP